MAGSIDYFYDRATIGQSVQMIDWSQIVGEYGPLVWRTAQRLLGHEPDSADCFQRTFVAAWELSQRQTIRHWPALLRRLATARALEQLRQRLKQRARFDSADGFNSLEQKIDAKSIEPNSAASSSELADHLRRALTEIDPREAQTFCLACVDDFSYAEIAEQLDLTANYVGVLLNRAKMHLRERLQAHDPQTEVASNRPESKP